MEKNLRCVDSRQPTFDQNEEARQKDAADGLQPPAIHTVINSKGVLAWTDRTLKGKGLNRILSHEDRSHYNEYNS